MKKRDAIGTILEVGAFLSFSALIITVLLQVFTRFLFPAKSFVWTEEASRIFFIYSIAFAAPLAMKNQEFVNVDIILNALPKRTRKVLELSIHIINIVLFSIVFFQAIKFAKLGIGQTLPTMRIPAYYAFSSIAMMTLFIVYYAIGNLRRHIQGSMEEGDVN